MAENRNNADFTYELKEHIADLKETKDGWKREVNVVAWNGNEPKIDIREWSPDHSRMTRGITLTEDEAMDFAKAIAERHINRQREESMRDPYER